MKWEVTPAETTPATSVWAAAAAASKGAEGWLQGAGMKVEGALIMMLLAMALRAEGAASSTAVVVTCDTDCTQESTYAILLGSR